MKVCNFSTVQTDHNECPPNKLIVLHDSEYRGQPNYDLCNNAAFAVLGEREQGGKSILCHICGTKPSIKPLTTDRIQKPLSFEFIRVFSALHRKKPVP